jgi:hypothetical protein
MTNQSSELDCGERAELNRLSCMAKINEAKFAHLERLCKEYIKDKKTANFFKIADYLKVEV